jgi:hypothetical protein
MLSIDAIIDRLEESQTEFDPELLRRADQVCSEIFPGQTTAGGQDLAGASAIMELELGLVAVA